MNKRGIIVQIFIVACALLLVGQAFYLQILDTSIPRQAINTVADEIPIYPSRGLILDRYDNIIVYNDQVYDIKVNG